MALRADDVDLGRDRALVEHFQGGDQLAFDDLYRRYFGRVYRFCLRRVGDRHEAEELAQEAFARAYRALPGLQGERRFYPWISVIASRLCVDSHRRRGRTEPSDTIDLGSVDGGQDAIVDASDAELLNLAFDRLATSHREVLKLREHEELSYQQIADQLSVTIGTVEARLFRARQALRREFAAVAGPDSGLAGIPVIGWLLRRFIAMRHRAADWAAALNVTPAIGGALAAVAVVVAGTTAISLSGGNGGTHSVSTTRTITSPQAARVEASPAASPALSGRSAGASGQTVDDPESRTSVGLAVPGSSSTISPASTGYDHTHDQAAQAPISLSTPFSDEVTVGVNPTNFSEDLGDDVNTAAGNIQSPSKRLIP